MAEVPLGAWTPLFPNYTKYPYNSYESDFFSKKRHVDFDQVGPIKVEVGWDSFSGYLMKDLPNIYFDGHCGVVIKRSKATTEQLEKNLGTKLTYCNFFFREPIRCINPGVLWVVGVRFPCGQVLEKSYSSLDENFLNDGETYTRWIDAATKQEIVEIMIPEVDANFDIVEFTVMKRPIV